MFQNIQCQVVDWTSIVFLESILLTIDCLLRLRQFLGGFGFFLTVYRNRRLNRFFWVISYCAYICKFRVEENIQHLYQVEFFLRATRGVVTEMHGHARILIRLSVELLSSRENHSWYRSLVGYDLCEYGFCKLSYIEWEKYGYENRLSHIHLWGQVGDCWN